MPCQSAICSHSLGRAWVHSLESKLDQAALHGLDIELFYEDLLYFARRLAGINDQSTIPEADQMIDAARAVRSLCDERGLTVMCLQPFMHYEGLRDRREHGRRVEEMNLWVRMCRILGANVIAIPSTFLQESEASGDMELIVGDLREVADLDPEIWFAYEALAWGTYVDTWEKSWEIVKAVDRANFGLCLDTFNMAGRVYADPAASDRRNPDGQVDFDSSMRRLTDDVDVDKIVYIQIADAEYLPQPLVEGNEFYEASQPPRMSWSRNCRLFYGEQNRGGYLPVHAILKVLFEEKKYSGWVSSEIFHRDLTDSSPQCPQKLALRAAAGRAMIDREFSFSKKPVQEASESETGAPLGRAQL
ncbi:hypothetical protein MBLNU230_g2789t1 [Neophaeotheca triangularis]